MPIRLLIRWIQRRGLISKLTLCWLRKLAYSRFFLSSLVETAELLEPLALESNIKDLLQLTLMGLKERKLYCKYVSASRPLFYGHTMYIINVLPPVY